MAKARTLFFCGSCGFESPRWLGRCPACETWNSFAAAPAAPKGAAARAVSGGTAVPVRLADVQETAIARMSSGIREFDAVLGGGIVPGSLTLVGGPPGAGKSTLVLQLASFVAASGARVVYVCGEESPAQITLRAARVHADREILVIAETNLRAVLDALERETPALLIVDSIQTVWLPESESYAGSVTQIRDTTQVLMEFAKRRGCAAFVVGHVTKEGAIAGPRILEHLVDTVLYFEGDTNGEYRILRAYKNRFGSVDEICVFSMHADGLHEVANPSDVFLSGRGERPSGSCVVASIVGSRPVLVEVQALVGEAAYGTPRRLAANLDPQRLAMIVAILERRVGMNLGTHDIYTSVAGGLRVVEPAADLGIALAIGSAFRDVALPADAAAFGELGLSGELRTVLAEGRREGECRKLGFRTLFTPRSQRDIVHAIDAALRR
ncbi:MAG: DNA repair protein RadA [Candidatus Eremiobacteraeota bacterium]|nr:DNA repair protein RadA [Candidatus Eremiobacteraeota bacterium]